MKHLYLLTFFILISHSIFSQSTAKDEYVISMAKKAGLDDTKVNAIQELLKERNDQFSEYQRLKEERESKYILSFNDDDFNEESINNEFRKKLTEIVNLEEFEKIFFEQLEGRVNRITDKKLQEAKSKYDFSKKQENDLKKILYANTLKEEMIKEYYAYDKDYAWNQYIEYRDKFNVNLNNHLKDWGFVTTKNKKTDYLIQKAREAGIDEKRIQQIMDAIIERDLKYEERLRTWRKNDTRYAIYFHDEGFTDHQIRMDLRKELHDILNYDEFKVVFLEQMQPWIDREVENDFFKIRDAYRLTNTQLEEVKNFLNEKITAKVITKEYYNFNYDLYQQKLRAVEYRHEKNFRDMIKKFQDENLKSVVEGSSK